MLDYSVGMGMAPELHPDVWSWVWKKFQLTNFIMPNCVSSMKYALKPVPGLADVGVPHGDGDGPRTRARGSGSKMSTYYVDQYEKLKGLSVQ